jgi:hypothetical protein
MQGAQYSYPNGFKYLARVQPPTMLGRRSCKVLALVIQGTCPRAARNLLKNVGSLRSKPTFEPSRMLQIQYENRVVHSLQMPDWDREGIVRR